MDQFNLLCEAQICGKPSKVFGIKQNLKTRSCEEHITSLLLGKGMQIHDIAGYDFVSTPQDAVAFEERKALVDGGRGNYAVLEAVCESELAAAMQAINDVKKNVVSAVEGRFEEMKAVVTGVSSEAKRQLLQVKTDLEQYRIMKESQLSPSAALICRDMEVIPKFVRFGLADVSDTISAVLSECWSVATEDVHSTLKCLDRDQKKTSIQSALTEATSLAQKGIPGALQYADSLIGDEASFEQDKDKVVSELLKLERNRVERNLKWMQKSWKLRQLYMNFDQAAIKVGQQIATLFFHQYGRFSEAEEILNRCYEVTNRQNPLSEDSLSICNEVCAVYFASGRYEQIEEYGMWVLDTFGTANLPAEYYWTTLLFLISSMEHQAKSQEITTLLEEWRGRKLLKESILTEMLRLLTYGIGDYEGKSLSFLRQARRIGMSHFPTSPFTALTLSHIALISSESARRHYHRQAQSLYEVVSPKSVQAADNFLHLGEFLQKGEHYREAETCYRQAQSIYETADPESIRAANNLVKLGCLVMNSGLLDQALVCYRKAQSIFEIRDPKSIIAGIGLKELGDAFAERNRWSEAEECYKLTQLILESADSQSTAAACNLIALGDLLKKREKWREAEQCYRQSQSILKVTAPQSTLAAGKFRDLGDLHKGSERLNEAEECYRRAQSIYELADPQSTSAAYNLISIGDLLMWTERLNDSESCYRQAQLILEVVDQKSTFAAGKFTDLGDLLKEKQQWSEAAGCYRQALAIYETVDPKSGKAALAYLNFADLLEARKQTGEAIECYKKAALIYTERGNLALQYKAEEAIVRLVRSGCIIS